MDREEDSDYVLVGQEGMHTDARGLVKCTTSCLIGDRPGVSQGPGEDDIGKKEGARWWMTTWPISFFIIILACVVLTGGEATSRLAGRDNH